MPIKDRHHIMVEVGFCYRKEIHLKNAKVGYSCTNG
jgi:hypothetical protein